MPCHILNCWGCVICRNEASILAKSVYENKWDGIKMPPGGSPSFERIYLGELSRLKREDSLKLFNPKKFDSFKPW